MEQETVMDIVATPTNDYASAYTYDANGNLLTLTGTSPDGLIDDFEYHYIDPDNTNQLDYVDDNAIVTSGVDDSSIITQFAAGLG